MDRSIFRAYSIRGVVDETLTAGDMQRIGQAVGTTLGGTDAAVVVGHDHRIHSESLAAALTQGLLSTGTDVISIGACPTPLLNYATDHCGATAGLMVTASHNPPRYNGLKIRTDHTLRGDEILEIYERCLHGPIDRGEGTLSHRDPKSAYVDAILHRAQLARSLKVVVDAGNGAAGPIVPHLLAQMGCEVIELDCTPDGLFPNRVPDPTAPGALDHLAACVCQEQADIGLAYDGDGDRLAAVDETGQVVLGDRILALLALDLMAQSPGETVIYELACTQALPEAIQRAGGTAVACPVGYAFVHEKMRETGAALGGESAGHVFFRDDEFLFDDAVLAGARLLALLSKTAHTCSALLDKLPQYTPSDKYRFHCPEKHKGDVIAHVVRFFASQNLRIETLDGCKVYWTDGASGDAYGWGLVRPSNTEPAIALRCEARTRAQLEVIEQEMRGALDSALSAHGI